MHTHNSKLRYMITIIIIIPQNNLIRHQFVIQNEEACVLTKEDMLSIFSNLAIMVLDVNFINPTETANFLFFDDREDAKKTDNNVVKGKGCLIHVHEDINKCPPSPADEEADRVVQEVTKVLLDLGVLRKHIDDILEKSHTNVSSAVLHVFILV